MDVPRFPLQIGENTTSLQNPENHHGKSRHRPRIGLVYFSYSFQLVVNLTLASNSQLQDPHVSIKFFLRSGILTLWLCPELAQNSSGSTTGTYRRLRPLSTRRFGQPRRLGSRRASSPSGARAGGLSVKPCACSPAPLPPLLLPSFRRALPLTSWCQTGKRLWCGFVLHG